MPGVSFAAIEATIIENATEVGWGSENGWYENNGTIEISSDIATITGPNAGIFYKLTSAQQALATGNLEITFDYVATTGNSSTTTRLRTTVGGVNTYVRIKTF